MAPSLAFGDNVRVRSTPATIAIGLAGAAGQVYGVTTPSVTGVTVIGDVVDDCAFAVQCPGRDDAVWFSADLLEFVDHGAGTEIRLDGVDKKWTRAADGSWVETPTEGTRRRPWWKFW